MKKIQTAIAEFFAETENDSFGGKEFWTMIEENVYEPDTMSSLRLFVNKNTDFIDLGAANGAISLIAASLGARVLAIEAAPSNFKIIERNFSLNPFFQNRMKACNVAVSNLGGTITFSKGSNSKVFSNIVFSKPDVNPEVIEVQPLDQIVDEFHEGSRDLLIKMDIEGAEWLILGNNRILENLKLHEARMLLAIHPGFQRSFLSKFKVLEFAKKKFWQIKNILEVYKVFRKIMIYADIRRTNLEIVQSPKKIVMLMFGGYFEFIVEFKTDERA